MKNNEEDVRQKLDIELKYKLKHSILYFGSR